MKTIPSRDEALELMRELNIPKNIIDHQLAVMRKARDLAHQIDSEDLNYDLVIIGGLIHDIGRFITHGLGHGAAGGDFLREKGYDDSLARVVERHVMGGLTEQEAEEFGLPIRSYVPETLEEKIVCLADKYFSGDDMVSIHERFKKWIEKHGETEFLKTQIKRVEKIEEEILKLIFYQDH